MNGRVVVLSDVFEANFVTIEKVKVRIDRV